MSAGDARVALTINLDRFREACDRLADALDPLAGMLRQQAAAYGRGERVCGLPHGEGRCARCGAQR